MLRSVIPNSDLARAANLLMDLYGAEASMFASMRSKRRLDENNLDGALIWLRVFAAIEGLTYDPRQREPLNWAEEQTYQFGTPPPGQPAHRSDGNLPRR